MTFRTLEGGVSTRGGVSELPHDRSEMLWSEAGPSAMLVESIDRWVGSMLADERGGGDGPEVRIEAELISKSSGVLCGNSAVERLLESHFPDCSAQWFIEEGGEVSPGVCVAVLLGPARSLLRLERILLNLIGRMSGIATNTSQWCLSAGSLQVAATRKTAWGLLDKWAIHVGGGLTHRLDRGDALMLKENDIAAMSEDGETSPEAIERIVSGLSSETDSFTTVEVRNGNEAMAAARAWDGRKSRLVLMFDNMGPATAGEVVRSLIGEGLRERCVLEGSGGVTMESLSEWTGSGVDVVSSSRLNMGVSPIDFSMLVGGA